MPAQDTHDIAVIPLVQNARDVKHAVLEDLDCNLLAQECSVSVTHHHHRDGVMPEPRCPLGGCLLASSLDEIPLA